MKREGQANGRTVNGQEVIDGKVWDSGRWVDGVVFNPDDYSIAVSGDSKESAKAGIDGHKEVPESFRRAILMAVDGLRVGGFKTDVRWRAHDGGAEFEFRITALKDKPDSAPVKGNQPTA